MPDRTALVYRYDGTYAGLLCCAAECFRDKRLPADIQPLDEPQGTLLPVKAIATDEALARRVELSAEKRISRRARRMLREAFLTCMEHKEMRMIRFLLLGYKYGDRVRMLTTNEDVYEILQALRYLNNEANRYIEFTRFSDLGEFLAAEIAPNNNVLPLVAPHFCDRFPAENLMIFDKTHGLGFLHRRGGEREFFQADALTLPPPSEEEAAYRALWKNFYRTVAVEGRENPNLRRTHMPMRYWAEMTEMRDAVPIHK